LSNWIERQNRRIDFYEQLTSEISNLSKDLQEEPARSSEQIDLIFDFSQKVFDELKSVLELHPTLESLFEKEFGPVEDLYSDIALKDICLIDEFIYPETEQFPFYVEGRFSPELFESGIVTFKLWLEEITQAHNKTQLKIKESFDPNEHLKNLECQCIGCLADFRAKTRDHVLSLQKKTIDDTIEELYEKIITHKIDQISDVVSKLKRKLEKNFLPFRSKLRKGSLSKLDNEISNYYKINFDSNSALAKTYKEKLLAYFNGILTEQDIKPDLINQEEYARFFEQLHTNIWKPAGYLRREFEKLINSVMAFKRKDISATILKNYLGQFWIHSDARKIKRKIVYHMGPTNSGKTYHAIEKLCSVNSGAYLAPLRLLASELYDTMNSRGVPTTLLTGEEVIEIEHATHFSSTIEMARLHDEFDCVVIDEIQMITDPQRGWAWTRALVNMIAKEVHLCGDPSVLELIKKILKLTGDELEVKEYTRMTELKVANNPITLSKLDRSDALIVFSRRNALKYKSDLERLDFKVSIVYGRLSPEVRREQARKFDEGETDIMVSTDAIAMGMNLPVKRIVFSALSKHFDNKEYPLSFSEIKQIAGRAGRFGRFPIGEVTCLERVQDGIETLEYALESTLDQNDKCMVGPDLEIFSRVNDALSENGLRILGMSEFLRLFNTMTFEKPFYCVDLKEMIELAEMVEDLDTEDVLTSAEKFGFTCAPVNLGLIEHVQYFNHIVGKFVSKQMIENVSIDTNSDNIDYLETAIKCVELYQWLARHFDGKFFLFDEIQLLENKSHAIEKLNEMLSERLHKNCSSCGVKMSPDFKFNICEKCFDERNINLRRRSFKPKPTSYQARNSGPSSNRSYGAGKSSDDRSSSTSGGSFKSKKKKSFGRKNKKR
jgi:ATP-dependent RNA helicase SUPV3L1/SUV3